MSKNIKVGDLTHSFWKGSERPESVVPTPAEQYETAISALAQIAELTRRLSDLENQIVIKVDSGDVISAITLAEEALLIQSDKVAVLGETSFFDYVRDQNGTATGKVDPSMTIIRGGVIQTERIIAGLWPERGSVFDLDNGNLIIGGADNPRFEYNDALATLDVRGNIKVSDTYESNGTTVAEYGQFQTGTADYTAGSGFSGSGILVGTPGIYGLSNGVIKLGFDANSGDAFFDGSIDTSGYVSSSGNEDAGFNTNWGYGTYSIESSMYGLNTVDQDNTGKVTCGVTGRATGVPASGGYSVGVFGHVDAGTDFTNAGNKIAVAGLGYQGGIGGLFYSDVNVAVKIESTQYQALDVTSGGVGHFAVKATGEGGIYAVSTDPVNNAAIYAEGILLTTERISKADNTKGRLTLYNEDGSIFDTYRYKFE